MRLGSKLAQVIKTIVVPCSREKAFVVFVDEIDTWWPLGKRSVSAMKGGVAKSVSIDKRPGGRIVEIGHDSMAHLWGTVISYDPFDSLTMDFHIGLPKPATASVVSVRFTALGADRTRVVLTHSTWEAYGDLAGDMRGGYGSSWGMIFEEGYMQACGG